MSKHKLVFFGNQKLATGISTEPLVTKALLQAGYEIVAEIKDEIPKNLADLGAEVAVLVAYGHIIPQEVIDIFPKGIINIHPSLLPLYRGPTPIETAILEGAPKTGVSIMKLTAGMDEGPIYKQRSVHLSGQETKQELAEKLLQLGTELIVEVLPGILSGQLKPRSQPHPNRATYSRKLTKADGVIKWPQPAQQIEREVRAFIGWPKSHAKIFDNDVILTKVRVASSPNNGPLVMKCNPGWLEIKELVAPSGRTMSGADFIRGYKK